MGFDLDDEALSAEGVVVGLTLYWILPEQSFGDQDRGYVMGDRVFETVSLPNLLSDPGFEWAWAECLSYAIAPWRITHADSGCCTIVAEDQQSSNAEGNSVALVRQSILPYESLQSSPIILKSSGTYLVGGKAHALQPNSEVVTLVHWHDNNDLLTTSQCSGTQLNTDDGWLSFACIIESPESAKEATLELLVRKADAVASASAEVVFDDLFFLSLQDATLTTSGK